MIGTLRTAPHSEQGRELPDIKADFVACNTPMLALRSYLDLFVSSYHVLVGVVRVCAVEKSNAA